MYFNSGTAYNPGVDCESSNSTLCVLTADTKWDSDSKVATAVVTETYEATYSPPTQAQITATRAIAADAQAKADAQPNSTAAVAPKYTVVSGLQFVQSALSPTVIGSEDLDINPGEFFS